MSRLAPVTHSTPSKSSRRTRTTQTPRHRRNRLLRLESLEGRSLLAMLVSEALSGTADTSVVGTVYEDLNQDGVKNGSDDGIEGWQVYLDLDQSGTLNRDAEGVLEPSAVTNVDGDYEIKFLKPANYRVSEVMQDGWTATSPVSQDVVVKQGKNIKANFFNFAGGDIAGVVWNDLNGDGVRDTNPATSEFTDPGLAGWTVFLDLNDDTIFDSTEPSTLTDTAGGYSFVNLPAGDYEVTEVLPIDWEPSRHFDIRQTASVSALQQTTLDFANFSTSNGSLRGTVWHDVNLDGVRNTDPDSGEFTEPGIADWTVFLDQDNNGAFDPAEPSAVTDANGSYVFVSLPAGDYDVVEILPSGWDVSPEFDSRQSVTVEPGAETIVPDFANFNVANGSLAGTIWNDVNRNGVRDKGLDGAFKEPGLQGWTVFLDLDRNSALDATEPTVLTDLAGAYKFLDLQVGEYEVREIVPTGWEVATTFSDNESVVVYSGMESTVPDFANFNLADALPGSVSGVVWNDLNGNGLRDVNPSTSEFSEPGLEGWTVFADLDTSGSWSTGEPQDTSDANGAYSLTGVLPGTVTIVEQVRSGWRPTSPRTNVRTLPLRNGENVTGLDFGNEQLKDSTIRGTVFADSNKDHARGATERGLADITVYLDLDHDSTFDSTEPSAMTSSDLFFTPAVDEAGSYSFTHLAPGTYTVRAIVPATLSATPPSELTHVVTITGAEDRAGVDTAAVFRASEIHGVRFDDANGNHKRDDGEVGVEGATVFVDLDRDGVLDDGEPSAVTRVDGSYSFGDLLPGAYVVREVSVPGYEHTYPNTVGGILWPSGESNPAVGNVDPTSITKSLAAGINHRQMVSITLPNTGALTNLVDVFLLFDDTGSFVSNSPIVRAAFPDIIASLQASLPGIDLGFGVGRFEEYANFAYEYATGRPFVLNQPIVAASNPDYLTAIQAALNRTTPGYGGDQPETDIEALYQLVTGVGFDGNNNGSVLDSGRAGLAATQLNPGSSGDVPSFASFLADPAASVLPASGTVGGAGFRAGALPIILTATDTGFAYQPHGEVNILGVGGVSLPLSSLTETSRPTTPYNSGAGIQQTVTALNALGALVIGLGTNAEASIDPRQGLESLSKLTGAVNRSTSTIANGTADAIAPGDPFYFQISTGFASSVASGVVNAIQNAVTNVAVNIDLRASDPRVKIINHTGVLNGIGAGQTATFDVEFQGDGVPHRFDLQFVRAGTNVVLGSIPVVIGTPIPGDGYEFEDLDEGEIEVHSDFGARASSADVNSPPSFSSGGNVTVDEDAGAQSISPWATNISPGPASEAGQVVDFVVTSDPSALFSSLPSISADGLLTFTPAANAHGVATVTVRLHDNGGTAHGGVDTSAAQTFAITIASVSDAPTAAGDSYSMNEDTTLNIAAATGVLANDSDVDGDSLTAVLVHGPSHGTVTLSSDGSFAYTPDANYQGADSFTYHAHDGLLDSAEATVAISIANVSDAPTAAGDSYSMNEDTTLNIAATGVLTNDSDVDGDALTAVLVHGPSHGTVTLNTDGSFAYTPDANYQGADSFTYHANDGLLDSAEATVAISIANASDAPTAAGDSYSMNEDTTLNIAATGVLSNDADVDGDALTAVLVHGPSHGTVTLNSDGSFAYTPAANYHGVDSFTYHATDGLLDSAEATVAISIANASDAPTAAGDSYKMDEDTTLNITAAGVLTNDSDVDGDALTAVLVHGPTHGTVTFNSDGSFAYTPAANYQGADSFTYHANDGLLDSAEATVAISIANVSDAPTAAGDSYSMNEGTTLNIAAAGVLTNDSDADGDSLTAVLVNGPSHGAVTLNSDGSFAYTPAANYVGADSFTYRASDGLLNSVDATVAITVTGLTTKFIVVDYSRRDAYMYDATGRLVVNHDLNAQDQRPMGVAANKDGSLSWVVDGKGMVFVYDGAGNTVGSWRAKDADKPEGIATDGTNIWIVDGSRQRIYVFAGAADRRTGELRATSSFPLDRTNSNPKDVTTDGAHLWVVNDSKTVDKVYRYTMAGKLDGSWTIDPTNKTPTGLTIDPNHVDAIWIVDAGTDRVYEYGGATGRTSGQQSANNSFALAAGNNNPQGIADPRPRVATSSMVDATSHSANASDKAARQTRDEAVSQFVTEHAGRFVDDSLEHLASSWRRFKARRGTR